MAVFCLVVNEKMRNFRKIRNEKISLKMRKFREKNRIPQVFYVMNCCSYGFRKIWHRFRIFLLKKFSQKSAKVCVIRTKIFAFFR